MSTPRIMLNTLNKHAEDEGQEYFVMYYIAPLESTVIVLKMCFVWTFYLLTEIYEVYPTGCDWKKEN